MIKNNILGTRLNTFRSGNPISIEPKSEDVIPKTSSDYDNGEFSPEEIKKNIFEEISFFTIQSIWFIIKTIIFGIAINTIFSMDWKFIAMMSVGAATELIITKISSLFQKT